MKMHELRYLLITLSLFLTVGNAKSYCQITQAETWTDRLFAHIVQNRYELLLTDRLQPNQQISLLCDGNAQVFTSTCQTSGQFSPALPSTNCSKAIQPSVVPTVSSTCPHTMYSVGFQFGNAFMELYRNCYDATTMTAYFSISLVYPTYLNSGRPPTAFDKDGIISPADEATFQQRSVYNRFTYLFGSGQTYVPSSKSLSFDRGHLTPVADYSFPKILRQTNKYLNVVPQYYSINRSNWKIVENWVRGQKDVLKVCTGSLDVLQLLDRSSN
uniref:Endonuclease n=1 Tax=Drosophila erecta TaxID=7220 RepID=B3P5R4_DROER